jgi:hypothetical protein
MKTSIDVDRALADEAAEILGTTTLKETVNVALSEVIRARLREQLAAAILDGTLSVPSPEDIARSKEPRVPVGAMDALRFPDPDPPDAHDARSA